ncbi:protein unc-45 homolog B-like isoform X1 [Mytilus trossulus]|uniref:protein unc-45 homolog B-like isoform X1 n=2 Tax=Mytilus trossulus TaxID=6551 RepID=UPI00300460B5
MKVEMASAQVLREEGNKHFKSGDIDSAISCYTQALDLGELKETDKAIIYKNRAACHLKKDKFSAAVQDATASLEIVPDDPKALYRRCQAYEKLDKAEEAYKDAAALMKSDPKNTAVQPILKRLNPIIQEKVKEQNSTSSKVAQMFNFTFDPNCEKEKRINAANNLVVLAKEEAGAKFISEQNGIAKLKQLLEERDPDIIQASLRTLACLSQGSKERSKQILEHIELKRIGFLIAEKNNRVSTSATFLLEKLLVALTDLELYRAKTQHYKDERKQGNPCIWPKFEMTEEQQLLTDNVFTMLSKMIENAKVSASGRDNVIELIIKYITRETGLHWTRKFLDTEGLDGLLAVASAIKQHETCTLPISDSTKMHSSVCMSKIYDDLRSDKERDLFKEKCSNFFKELFSDELYESKVEAIKAVSTLLQGPYEVGNVILSFEGVTDIMLHLAGSKNPLHQQVAVEAIVHSASKKDKCTGLLAKAVPLLQQLIKEADDQVKVRALVGLCKLGSAGGSDASDKQLAEGSTMTLAKVCRKFLVNPSKDIDIRRWATEGLAYLTLDAEIKEELVNDTAALKSLIEVTTASDKNVLYPAATVFVNVTNSYDVKDVEPELVELAKFAKQHVPEKHDLDKPEHIKARVHKVAEAGVCSALVALCNTDSIASRELISRVYLAIATEEDLRGLIVQQGAAKALLKLAIENNTEKGLIKASHALAKLSITMNPQTTFPGQRMYELVRPLLSILHLECTALENFEALLALTNLSSISESVRKRILAEKGFSKIEHYMFEEHELLKRASTECMCNLVMSDEVVKLFEGENDRVKLLVLYCGDEDDPLLVRAAAGSLAVLTHSEIVCKKVLEVKPHMEMLQSLLVNENVEIQHRGCYIMSNLINSSKEIAEKLLEGQMLEILMAISILKEPERQRGKELCEQCLKKAIEYGIIKPNK